MLFNSLEFLIFAPTFFIIYFLLSGYARLAFIVVASYFFYGWWDWRFLSLILISTTIDYTIGLAMDRTSDAKRRRMYMYGSLISNLGILGIFKYYNFFTQSFHDLMNMAGVNVSLPLLQVILPVGISFYTFQTLSYTIDLYRGQIKAEHSFIRFAAYVSLFPQLVAGPIVRAASLIPQLHIDHPPDAQRMARGLEMVIWGFFLKLCLADNAAAVVDTRFDQPYFYGTLSHIVGIVFFSFQIYGDFAGYSLIAIGLGRIMGFDFGINFNRPYFSRSFSEFWQRWHISLSSWLRDYLYISLGGNRHGKYKTYRNLFLTMVLGGLWHGAGLNFIVWGLLHGLYLVLQRMVGPFYWAFSKACKLPSFLSNAFLILVTFTLTNFAWIYFRADSMEQANTIIKIIARFDGLTLAGDNARIAIIKTFIIVMIVLIVDWLGLIKSIRDYFFSNIWLRIAAACLSLWMISLLGSFEGANFIYFQF